MFSTQSDNCNPFVHVFDIIILFAAELEEPKIGISGKGLSRSQLDCANYVQCNLKQEGQDGPGSLT